jgi:hypothetical protein
MPKFKPVRDIAKASCIRLLNDVRLGDTMRGGAPGGTTNALYPSQEPDLRVERKAGALLIGLVQGDFLYEVEVSSSNVHSIVYLPVKAEPEEVAVEA